MDHDKYIRTIQELEAVGSKWWPEEVKREAEEMSILQYFFILKFLQRYIKKMRWAFFLDIISKKSSISPVPTTSLIQPCFLFPAINIASRISR